MRKFLSMLIMLLSFVAISSPAMSGILLYDDCESSISENVWKKQGSWPYYPDKRFGWAGHSTEQARSGNGSYKFYLPGYGTNSDPCGSTSCQHVQLNPVVNSVSRLKFNTEYWVGFSMYLPYDFNRAPGGWFDFFDTHQDPDPCDFPINLIDTATASGKEVINFRIRGDSRQCTPSYDAAVRWVERSIPLPSNGAWHDFVLHFKLSYNPEDNPFFQAYIDGNLVISDFGINAANDSVAPFLKLGIYGLTDQPLTLYYDEIRIGDASSSYSEVAPGGGSTVDQPNIGNELKPPILKIIAQQP